MSLLVDKLARLPVFLDALHSQVHQQHTFWTHRSATLANAEVLSIAITTPAITEHKRSHLTFTVNGTASCTFDLLEDVTSFAGGTAFTPKNHVRESGVTSVNTALTGVTGVDAITPTGGSAIFIEVLSSGVNQPFDRARVGELILKSGTKYLFRITNGPNSNAISLFVAWYEYAGWGIK
jgi:hypothetical protein